MEDVVNACGEAIHHIGISYIPFDKSEPPCILRVFEVPNVATDKIVDHPYFCCSCLQELVHRRTANKPCTSSYQYAGSLNRIHIVPSVPLISFISTCTTAPSISCARYDDSG